MFTLRKKHLGFSMIEVLVSLIVIGVGMLGLSGLQIASMKGTSNAHSRNVATMLGMDLSDRMRANPLGVSGDFYSASVDCETKERLCRGNAFCTPEQTAKFDIQEVMCGMLKSNKSTIRYGGAENLLPNGTLDIACTDDCSSSDAEYEVELGWNLSKLHEDQADNSQAQTIKIVVLP